MQYGQIVSILAVCFLLYYAFMVVSDILKAKAAQTAGQEDKGEEDIDISDEAGTSGRSWSAATNRRKTAATTPQTIRLTDTEMLRTARATAKPS